MRFHVIFTLCKKYHSVVEISQIMREGDKFLDFKTGVVYLVKLGDNGVVILKAQDGSRDIVINPADSKNKGNSDRI